MQTERNTSTLTQLKAWYEANPAKCRFEAEDRSGFAAWRDNAHARLSSILGFEALEQTRCPVEAEVVECIEEKHYTGEKLLVRVQADMWVPAWFLVPKNRKGEGPHPAVMCLHGHGMSKDVIIGRPRTEEEKGLIDFYKGDYGRSFAEAGYAAFCPDVRGFGERDGNGGCPHILQNALAMGQSITGLRMWDHLRCFEYVLSRPEVDTGRVGAAGLSMGCEHSMMLAALDERISFAIFSCCLRDLREEIHDSRHCPCSYVPGLFRYFDWTDIACMIAPRSLLVQQGLQDYVPMPLVESALEKLGRAYELTDAPEHLGKDFFSGGHMFNFKSALDWLKAQG